MMALRTSPDSLICTFSPLSALPVLQVPSISPKDSQELTASLLSAGSQVSLALF